MNVRITAAILALSIALAAQTPSAPAQPAAQPSSQPPSQAAAKAETAPFQTSSGGHIIRLRYPRDRDVAVATVDGVMITLDELLAHIDERHYPGFRKFMAGPDDKGSPDSVRMLESDLIAPWVRTFADVKALQAEAKTRGYQPNAAEEAIAAVLKAGFAEHLEREVLRRKQQNLPEISKRGMDSLLADYQLRFGLACELQGWLDFLAPEENWSEQQLNDFFQSDVRIFGGSVTIAHILVQHRDAGTGIMLDDEGRKKALGRLAEIKASLAKDGSNFAEVARKYSEDSRTAADGGLIQDVDRFDHRLPAAICRAAWGMRDGQISEVVETQYGWHLILRVEQVTKKFMLFTPGAMPMVKTLKKKMEQENLLFGARQRHAIDLKL